MSKDRLHPKRGWVNIKYLPKGANGRALCRYCNVEVKPPRKSFCSDVCVHEWKIRSNPSYVRQCLRKRDKGICAKCGIDTYAVSKGLRKPLKGESREEWQERCKKVREEWNIPAHRMTLFDADHRLSVVEGGGVGNPDYSLDSFDSLCLLCHRKKTKELMERLKSSRPHLNCSNCNVETTRKTPGRCKGCSAWFKKHGIEKPKP